MRARLFSPCPFLSTLLRFSPLRERDPSATCLYDLCVRCVYVVCDTVVHGETCLERTHHVGYVPPSFKVRAHNTPVKEQVDNENHGREEKYRDHLVVVHETRQSSDVHDPEVFFCSG